MTEQQLNHPARTWLRDSYMTQPGMTKSRAAEELGISHKVLNALIEGNYTGNADNQLAKLDEQRARLAGQISRPDVDLFHIPTPLMGRIWRAADEAKATHLLATIVGKKQMGKTTAIEAYKMRYPDTTVLTRMPAAPTVGKLVYRIAEAAGLARGRTIEETLTALRQHLCPRHLLIIDEAHLALTRPQGLDALDVLRELFDTCKCGLLIVVTDIGEAAMVNGPHAARLEQLLCRGETEKLPKEPIRADIRAIWEAYGLPEPDARTGAIITALVRNSCFGQYTRRLRYAVTAARREGRTLTWPDFIAVAEHFAASSH